MAAKRKRGAKRRLFKKPTHGKPPRSATALPFSIFGAMAGTVTIRGDILSPLDVDWDAEQGKLLSDE